MSDMNATPPPPAPPARKGILDWVEWAGNKLPEPAILFAILAAIVFVASGVASWTQWRVQPLRIEVVLTEKVDDAGRPVLGPDGKPVMVAKKNERGRPETRVVPSGAELEARSLMTSDGLYWMISSMIRNFVNLPALGLVFAGMLGIGLAEKFGLFSALMRFLALLTPKKFLTPVIVFIGANSSVASDAGYIILPPLAAALYLAVGRHPIAGLAAVFAGVAGGFGGGFFPTAADGFLAGTATTAAQVIDPGYGPVTATHNLYFKSASAIVVMLAGWFVTDRIVEPRLQREKLRNPDAQEAAQSAETLRQMQLTPREKKGLLAAVATNLAIVGVFAAIVLTPGAPLYGDGVPTLPRGGVLTETPAEILDKHDAEAAKDRVVIDQKRPVIDQATKEVTDDGYMVLQRSQPANAANPEQRPLPAAPSMIDRVDKRWSQAIVPLIFFAFAIPGIVYGAMTGTCRGQKDVVEGFYHGIRNIVPVLAISFFMGQFVAYFSYSGLDRMIANAGGAMLVQADLPVPLLLVLFVALVVAGDFAISGMLSKFGIMAPIFIPMFMMVGMSPELTTAAYRIGDSVVNIITPLNSYLLIILAVLQKYKKDAGLGSLISLMLPYSVIFFVVWTTFLLIWYFSGVQLGAPGPIHYIPPY